MGKSSPKRRESAVVGFAADAQRYVILALVVIVPLVIARPALQPFSTPKTTWLLSGAVVLVALQVTRWVTAARLHTPWRAFGGVVAALVVALLVATTQAGWRASAVWGVYGRETGLALYLAGVVVLAVAARRFGGRATALAATVVATGTVVAAIAVTQRLSPSLVPIQLVEQSVGANATLANPNFTSGFLGIVLPLVVWFVLVTRDVAKRATGIVAALVCLAGLWASDSMQGWIAGAAGVAVLLLFWILQLPAGRRRPGVMAWWTAMVVGLGVGLVGLAGRGPLGVLGDQSAFAIRRWYWSAAAGMWQDNPLLGVGLDQYGAFYRRYRPIEDVLAYPINLVNDAAHNVPLMMLSGGGVLLFVAYLALAAYVGWRVLAAVRRDGANRLLIGALAGAWAAYHVQSLVSIDVAPLALMHFVLAGALLAACGAAETRAFELPWKAARSGRRTKSSPVTVVAVAVALLVAVPGLVVASWPLRADLAAGEGSRLLAAEQAAAAVGSLEKAYTLSRYRPRYGVLLGGAQYTAEEIEASQQTFEATAERESDLEAVMWAARANARLEDVPAARQWYQRALEVEPHHPSLKVEVAEFEAANGGRDEALRLVEEALALDPANGEALELRDRLASAAPDPPG